MHKFCNATDHFFNNVKDADNFFLKWCDLYGYEPDDECKEAGGVGYDFRITLSENEN